MKEERKKTILSYLRALALEDQWKSKTAPKTSKVKTPEENP